MDAHSESDCEQQLPENFSPKEDSGDNAIIKSPSNPEAEEEQRLTQHGGESEFESEVEEEETEDLSPGLTAMSSHLPASGQERQPDSESIIARIKRRQEQELKQQHMEREYMAHTMMRDEIGYLNSPESNHHHPAGNGNSKSATPSPTSPPPTQYLYAAGHPFSSALFNPSHMVVAAQAAAAMASAAHHHPVPNMSAGSSPAGSATPPNNGIGGMSSPRGAAGEGDQSKYTFEEQFKQKNCMSSSERMSLARDIQQRKYSPSIDSLTYASNILQFRDIDLDNDALKLKRRWPTVYSKSTQEVHLDPPQQHLKHSLF